jgi:hypothetical protein
VIDVHMCILLAILSDSPERERIIHVPYQLFNWQSIFQTKDAYTYSSNSI